MIRLAQVVDIQDVDEQGKIKIKIFPELTNIPEDSLPWAKPMMTNYEKKHCIPEVDSFLYVEINEEWTTFYYLDSVKFLVDNYKFAELKSLIQGIDEITSAEYPHPDFKMNPNGFIEFYNRENTETGFIHPSGTFVVFKENGDYYIKNPDMFEMHFSEGQVEIKNVSSIKLGDSSDSAVLYSPLKDILDSIKSHTHSFSYVAGVTPYSLPSSGTTDTSSGLSGIDTTGIQSELVTLD